MKGAALTRWLHLGNRWLGMALGWFVSGVVMLFVARPQLTELERLAALPAIAAGSVKFSPQAAWQLLALSTGPSRCNTGMASPDQNTFGTAREEAEIRVKRPVATSRKNGLF